MADQREIKVADFEAIALRLASPEEILSWSYGEVTKAETINYRTYKPEREGLFSEQIFGPVKDFECACGKYKSTKFKGVSLVCDRCGVEVTRSYVRRERMGHIMLATPVAHIWFLKSIPSRIGLILDLPSNDLEKVVYYNSYIVTSVNEEEKKRVLKELENEYKNRIKKASKEERIEIDKIYLEAKKEIEKIKEKVILSERDYLVLSRKYGNVFIAETGGEPIKRLLESIDLKKLKEELEEQLKEKKQSEETNKKIRYRLKLVNSMLKANIRPEWMFLTVLPVIPPELRPMVQLEGGKFASSDLNDLYRRVINRNNRLKKLIELKAPEVIIKNEKRMLQEAVDALLDNTIRKSGGSTPLNTAQNRPLRSLTDILKGKKGRFRQNLLGKRVDYSGRSVIAVGPNLKINECGLPKRMALELFKPFIIHELIKRELAYNPKNASKLIEEEIDEVWEILENLVQEKYVLLNRAPTLHRLSIEAFKPKLIEGLAIQIPALVCPPFNADFDGDQMAVHLPLSEEAQRECETRMLSSLGLLKPANGNPVMVPRHEMVLGIYWLTMEIEDSKKEDELKIFSNTKEAILAYQNKKIKLQERIKVRLEKENNQIVTTTCGRVIFNEILPRDFPYINKKLAAKDLKKISEEIINHLDDFHQSAEVLDKIKELGFYYATVSGITWGLSDLKVPKEKKEIIEQTKKEVEMINEQYRQGLLTPQEKKVLAETRWRVAIDKIVELAPKQLKPTDPVFVIFDSGSRGNLGILGQVMGIKGLVVNPAGELIEVPILSCHQEGFSVLEYFFASHGGRKGLADTALKTSFAGYLTRRLVDVAQAIIIKEEDCGTKKGILISKKATEEAGEDFEKRIYGRVLLEDIKNKNGEVILKKGELISLKEIKKIIENGIEEVWVRSPLTCESIDSVCQKCYGMDLGWRKMIDLGEAVGIVAAQSIGEPGTQLTLRTFHTGGVARVVDITQGLPRVEEIFEVKPPKGEAPISEVDGEVIEIEKIGNQKIIRIKPSSPISSLKKKMKGKKEKEYVEYIIPATTTLWVKTGEKVKKGDQLAEGHLNLKKLFKIVGKDGTINYILKEVKKVYNIAGEDIHDKHFEVIIKQMFSLVKIVDRGDSDFIEGEVITKKSLMREIERLKNQGLKPPKYEEIIAGIKKVALNSDSFLAAASFLETRRVLVEAALEGKVDYLEGLKENVIIGRLIPAGTGFRRFNK
ncbi:MAG: DNA-directed RNA polymerase subunit beta' [Candidatus Paceibacterota bacterium]